MFLYDRYVSDDNVCVYNLHDKRQFLVFTKSDQVQVTSGNNY